MLSDMSHPRLLPGLQRHGRLSTCGKRLTQIFILFVITVFSLKIGLDIFRGEPSIICSDVRMPSTADSSIDIYKKYWQRLVFDDYMILAYSAYYDRRFGKDEGRIQILTVVNQSSLTCRWFSVCPMRCQLWYADSRTPLITPAVEVSHRRDSHASYGGQNYVKRQFECNHDASSRYGTSIPTHVSLVPASNVCRRSTILLPVDPLVPRNWTIEFGLCVAVSYGDLNSKLLIHWLELVRLMGVGEVNIYNATLSGALDPVLKHYADEGFVRIFQMPTASNLSDKKGVHIASGVSLNDCMLRNMYRYRFVTSYDFDEAIVPRSEGETYHDILQTLYEAHKVNSQTDDVAAFQFRNVYYFKELPPNDSEPEYMESLRHIHRAPTSGVHFTPKSFVNPRRCYLTFNHYCLKAIGWSRNNIAVDPKIATNNHFKTKCTPYLMENNKQVSCSDLSNDVFVDHVMEKYSQQLKALVTRKIAMFNHTNEDQYHRN